MSTFLAVLICAPATAFLTSVLIQKKISAKLRQLESDLQGARVEAAACEASMHVAYEKLAAFKAEYDFGSAKDLTALESPKLSMVTSKESATKSDRAFNLSLSNRPSSLLKHS